MENNNEGYNPETGKLNYSVWINTGYGSSVRRSALDLNDPDQEFNYVSGLLKDTGLSPQDFGIDNPKTQKYKHLSRGALEDLAASLEEQLQVAYKYL